jgi:hypothetical protein
MKNTEKYTKSQKLADIETILSTVETTEFDVATLIEFVQGEQAALARKAEKARETAAAKKTETDELGEAVYAVLTNEPQTRDQIAEQVEGDEVTVAKVGARLTKLVAAGRAVKTEVASVSASGKKSTKMAYTLAPAGVEVE